MTQQDRERHGASPPAGEPIFADMDLPCPQCGYNLRGLPASCCPECGTAFDPVIGYAAAWTIPVAACLLSLECGGKRYVPWLIQSWEFLLVFKSRPWALAFMAVLLVSCVMWAIALYHGGRIVSGGRRWPAVWYAACNPFWLIVLLLGLW